MNAIERAFLEIVKRCDQATAFGVLPRRTIVNRDTR
jgi:hypothetical protein